MFGLGPTELVIVFLIILLVFGAKRIPEIAQGLGKGINEFKRAAREVTDEFDAQKIQNTAPNPRVRNELKSQSAQQPAQQSTQQTADQRETKSEG